MNVDQYFYAKNTTLLINHCAFLVESSQGQGICVLRIRNPEGSFLDQVKLKDFGSSISWDYQNAAYNFDGMTP